ncbi:hypothetical protein F5Y19DRAFT_466091 [Xylariaceae sp. FL1651]|nr:hypothetical protein F5Y19DRAFT_466091 [Xylariaceae sp. FL1651]
MTFEEPVEPQPFTMHAVSTPILMRIKQGNIQASKFSNAAMMVALRQEIFIANTIKRSTELNAEQYNTDPSLEPAPEAVWAHRMIFHAAQITNFVYAEGVESVDEWDCLFQYLNDWDQRKPDSFRPMNYVSEEELGIPVIHYTYGCPIAGQQYLQLSGILLLAHDPRAPVLGLGRTSYAHTQEEKIRKCVHIIYGIARSNPEYMPARLTAGLTIALYGELFSEPSETTKLFRMVSEAELHLGWPCLKVSHRLQNFWGL